MSRSKILLMNMIFTSEVDLTVATSPFVEMTRFYEITAVFL